MIECKVEDARQQIFHLGNDWNDFVSAYTAANEYRLMSDLYVERGFSDDSLFHV